MSNGRCIKFFFAYAALILFGATNLPSANAGYIFTDLGTLGGSYSSAYAINNAGQVAGESSTTGDASYHATLWNGSTATDLGTLGESYSSAIAINNAGQVAGYSSTTGDVANATLWNGTVATDVSTSYSWAWAINDAGQVAGAVAGGFYSIHATLWNGTVATELGTLDPGYPFSSSAATAINNAGQVVGWSDATDNYFAHATLWNGSVATDLSTLGGNVSGNVSSAYAINNAGQVAGESSTTDKYFPHATLWNGSVETDLGTLGGRSSSAYAINNAGQVAGESSTTGDASSHATLWNGSIATDLNSLLDVGTLSAGWVLTIARGINDIGSIVGEAYNSISDQVHGFLLSDTTLSPTPSALAHKISVMNQSISGNTSWAPNLSGIVDFAGNIVNTMFNPQYDNIVYAANLLLNNAKFANDNANYYLQSGETQAASKWYKIASDEYQKFSIARGQAINGLINTLDQAIVVTNLIYKGSQFSWDAACAFAGPAMSNCWALGNQLFIATDAVVDSSTNNIGGVIGKAIESEIVNFLLGKFQDKHMPIDAGTTTLQSTLNGIVNSDGFADHLKEALLTAGFSQVAGLENDTLLGMLHNAITNLPGSNTPNNTQQTSVINTGNYSFNDSTIAVTGNVINFGGLNVTNAQVNFLGNFTNNGSYISDPSSNYFNNLLIGTSGYLVGGAGDLFSVSGDLINQSTQNTLWDTSQATLAFTGCGPHVFDLTGQDLGVSLSGYQNNFAWGTLDLSSLLCSIDLGVGNVNFTDALYLDDLLGAVIANGTITNIFGNGENIYYLASDLNNSYLHGLQYALTDGGFLIPIGTTPEPGTLCLMIIGLPWMAWRRRQSQLSS